MKSQSLFLTSCIAITVTAASFAFSDTSADVMLDKIIDNANVTAASEAPKKSGVDLNTVLQAVAADEEAKARVKTLDVEVKGEKRGFFGFFGSKKKEQVKTDENTDDRESIFGTKHKNADESENIILPETVADRDSTIKQGVKTETDLEVAPLEKKKRNSSVSSLEFNLRYVNTSWDFDEADEEITADVAMAGLIYQARGKKFEFRFGIWGGTGMSEGDAEIWKGRNYEYGWGSRSTSWGEFTQTITVAANGEISVSYWVLGNRQSLFALGIDIGANIDYCLGDNEYIWHVKYESAWGDNMYDRNKYEEELINQLTYDAFIGAKLKININDYIELTAFVRYSPMVWGSYESEIGKNSSMDEGSVLRYGAEIAFNITGSSTLTLSGQFSKTDLDGKKEWVGYFGPNSDEISITDEKMIVSLGYRYNF